MILESGVRDKLADFARGAISLQDFADWIDDHSWSMHSDSLPGAIELVSSIHGLLAERDARAIDDAILRRELLSLLNNVRGSLAISGGAAPALVQGPSASKVLWVVPAKPWALPVSA